MLERGGVAVRAAGNIGLPLIDAIRVSRAAAERSRLEVSSFQLAGSTTFRPRVAVLLNIAEDHTDWHGSMDAVRRREGADHREPASPTTCFVVERRRRSGGRSRSRAAVDRVVPFSDRSLGSRWDRPSWIGVIVWEGEQLIATVDIPLPGRAGLEDISPRPPRPSSYGVDAAPSCTRPSATFAPLGHRLEMVAEVDGVTYIDDSKATNPHATLAAVRGLSDVVLIAGGRSKGIDLSPLRDDGASRHRGRRASARPRTRSTRVFEGLVPVDGASSMADAVRGCARPI